MYIHVENWDRDGVYDPTYDCHEWSVIDLDTGEQLKRIFWADDELMLYAQHEQVDDYSEVQPCSHCNEYPQQFMHGVIRIKRGNFRLVRTPRP